MAISKHSESCARASALPPIADINGYGAGCPLLTQSGHSRAKEFASVRNTGAPRTPNSKSAYDRLFLTRFGCRERRSHLRVFIATATGEAIIEVNPG